MATLQERYVTALEARGCVRVTYPGRKYVKLTRNVKSPITGRDTFYFVGKAGAVRFGVSASESYASSDKFKAKLLDGTA